MAVPQWNDPKINAGTMVRSALWLVNNVGEGNVFTKDQLREAFPHVSQVDRRMRDLRPFGWVIHTSNEDVSLNPEEQRFVKAGVPVWDRKARREAAPKQKFTAKERQAVLAADGYQCTVCGIAGGEHYPENPVATAILSATRRDVILDDGSIEQQLVTECKECRSGAKKQVADPIRLAADIRELDDRDRARLTHWIERGRRTATPLDRAWTAYQRLPAESRAQIRDLLDE
ncbi:MAG: hypothetical protein M0026_21830 [Nocardiopsaceae bacterium]|nr:hypothetical protein [Nocardiopsaceae bacterium]